MSTSELSEVEALLDKVLPNPMGFAERVIEQVLDRLATNVPGNDAPVMVATYESRANDADQNELLAAALGACDCWGHDPACATCLGEGSAGWIPPDRGLYEEYVAPANARIDAVKTTETEKPQNAQPLEGEPA